MALTDKFNLLLNTYKTLNPTTAVGANALDGFLNWVKQKHPSFYNQAQAIVRDTLKSAQPQASGGGGEKPPTKPPIKKSPEPPEQPNKKNYTGTKQNMSPERQKEINKGLNEIYKDVKPTSKEGLERTYQGKTLSKGNLGTFVQNAGSNVGKVAQAAPKITPSGVFNAVKGVGNKLYQYAVPITYGASTIQDWNKEGSDWRTRGLDILGTGEALVDSAFATLVPNPYAGFAAGTFGLGRAAANKAGIQGIRDMNTMLNTSSIKDLTPEQQTAYERYQTTGVGGQLPSENYNLEPDDEMKALAAQYEAGQNSPVTPAQFDATPPIENLPALPRTAGTSEVSQPTNQNVNTPITGVETTTNPETDNFISNVINRANNMTVDEARQGLGMQEQQIQQAPIGNVNMNKEYNQLLNPEGQITPKQMRGYIDNYYAQMQNTINQNPYYGGQYIQPQGYNIDSRELARRQGEDEILKRTAVYGGGEMPTYSSAQQYMDNQRQMYNADMANRAGVPYEDYVKGMAERNAYQVQLGLQQAKDQLTAYAQQASTMNQRLAVYQALRKVELDAQNKLQEIQANLYKDLQIESLKGGYNLRQEEIKQAGETQRQKMGDITDYAQTVYQYNNPVAQANTLTNFMNAAGLQYNPQAMQIVANLVRNMTPEQQTLRFGRPIDPNNINDIFMVTQAAQQNPNLFQQLINRFSQK